MEKVQRLSILDKKILKALLSSTGAVSSAVLSGELDVPLSTVQRRRKRLESHLLDRSYALKTEMFGLRTADLFISTKNGSTSRIAKELLAMDTRIQSVNRVLGNNSTNLIAETKFRNNPDLIDTVERIRSLAGVARVSWIEQMESLGKNVDIWQGIIKAN